MLIINPIRLNLTIYLHAWSGLWIWKWLCADTKMIQWAKCGSLSRASDFNAALKHEYYIEVLAYCNNIAQSWIANASFVRFIQSRMPVPSLAYAMHRRGLEWARTSANQARRAVSRTVNNLLGVTRRRTSANNWRCLCWRRQWRAPAIEKHLTEQFICEYFPAKRVQSVRAHPNE